jgi:hypothetical protein
MSRADANGEKTDGSRYGFTERLLHRIAFATTTAQIGAADIGDSMYRRELQSFEPGPPLFVTALPRAGTTILLELLAATPEFASHTYREMPFVLCPMLWHALSGPFRGKDAGELRERAHGDGIAIGVDSPEAFEEIVWKRFFPKHYGKDRIEPWSTCDEREFLEFFEKHRRKIIALRRRTKPSATRYVSKNNANIARVRALLAALPEARLVVPIRDPLQHAESLLRQHVNFTRMHEQDPFVRRYMAGIGHHDFGDNLLPIDFDGWLATAPTGDATDRGFWLAYWLACHRHLAAIEDERLTFVDFTTLSTRPDLAPLADFAGIERAPLQALCDLLEARPPHAVGDTDFPADLAGEARALHADLVARALL